MSLQSANDGEASLPSILQRHLAHLTRLRDTLKEPTVHAVLMEELHDTSEMRLPSQEASSLASQTIDVLHETIQLLQPGHLVLADHFLGTPLSIRNFSYIQTRENANTIAGQATPMPNVCLRQSSFVSLTLW